MPKHFMMLSDLYGRIGQILREHGDGHLMHQQPRELLSADIPEDRTNHYNDHQGAFRYGWLDIPDLYDRIRDDARGVKFELDVTHCDEMDREQEFRRHFDVTNFHDTDMVETKEDGDTQNKTKVNAPDQWGTVLTQ